ncbi:MAG TPA: carboxylesterase/lipase family protein [Candidatus Deferrimicrobiaceae bacterium]|nr:carboxylesterase/lipase family protein [Candidatus Deferrimicrobiaceae bacterium]
MSTRIVEVLVETRRGTVRGVAEDGLAVFRGLPFARPPVGPLRFRPPEPPERWAGIRDATRFGPSAAQNAALIGPLMSLGIDRTGEDCLYLNVWTPRADRGRRPVLVWIHGGAFILGSGSQTLYDGATLARRGDVVVVTINYRLGALGFLRTQDRFGQRLPATGNEGLLDQIAALEWVRDEIEAFGGDPAGVTIFGESAGAMSCAILLGLPRARGLFQRAILQSGAANFRWPRDIASRLADQILADLGISSPDDLHAAAPARLLAAQRRLFMDLMLGEQHVLGALSPTGQRVAGVLFLGLTLARRRFGNVASPLSRGLARMLRRRGERSGTPAPRPAALRALRTRGLPFQPVIDGDVIPRDPLAAVRDGAARDVPLLIGTNLDEARLFAPLDPEATTLDEAALLARCEAAIPGGPDAARRAVTLYREARAARGESLEPGDLWFAIESDRTMRHPAMRLAALQAAHQPATYAYLFTWPSPAMGGLFGSCHALELPFVFGTLDHPLLRPFTGKGAEAHALAARIQDAWIAFARTGRPGHAGLGEWPAYDAAARRTMILDRRCRVEAAPREAERALWDSLDGTSAGTST